MVAEIMRIAKDNNVKAGVILSAVGSLRESAIRVPVLDGQIILIRPQNVEIVSLQGTVSETGLHLHISVSDTEGNVQGGHVKAGCIIRTTCELVIGIAEGKTFTREPDETTGYGELVVKDTE